MDTLDYKRGFVPYAVAAAVLSLCGGLTAAVPSNIVAAWGLEESMVTWFAMAYSLGAAVFAPVMGKLADILGKRIILLGGLALFAAGPVLAALCPDGAFLAVLLFRFLSGVGASAIAPAVLSYIMTAFPKEKLGAGFTFYMLLSCSMVIFGPTLGGILLSRTGWRSVLFLCAVLTAVAWVCCLLFVKKSVSGKRENHQFDLSGAALAVVFFSMLLAIPTFGQNNGWTAAPTLICILVGVLSAILLFIVEKRAANPILNGRFMARKQFVLPVVVLFLSQGLLQSCMTNIITFAILTSGDRTLSGIATSVLYVGMALGTIVIGPLADKREPRTIAAGALVFVAVGAGLQVLFSESTSLLLMGTAMFLIGLGLGGNGTIFLKVVLSGLTPELAGSGSGTYNVFRDMSAPFGVALFVPLFSAGLAERMAHGLSKAQAAVSALHSTAWVQVACVLAGIGICLLLPRIYKTQH